MTISLPDTARMGNIRNRKLIARQWRIAGISGFTAIRSLEYPPIPKFTDRTTRAVGVMAIHLERTHPLHRGVWAYVCFGPHPSQRDLLRDVSRRFIHIVRRRVQISRRFFGAAVSNYMSPLPRFRSISTAPAYQTRPA